MNKKVLKIIKNIAAQCPATGTIANKYYSGKLQKEIEKGGESVLTPVNHANQIKRLVLYAISKSEKNIPVSQQCDIASTAGIMYLGKVVQEVEQRYKEHALRQQAIAEMEKLKAGGIDIKTGDDGTVFISGGRKETEEFEQEISTLKTKDVEVSIVNHPLYTE